MEGIADEVIIKCVCLCVFKARVKRTSLPNTRTLVVSPLEPKVSRLKQATLLAINVLPLIPSLHKLTQPRQLSVM